MPADASAWEAATCRGSSTLVPAELSSVGNTSATHGGRAAYDAGVPAITVREAAAADEALLRAYLRLAIFRAPGAAPLPDGLEREPHLARYVDGWGRRGDAGVVALDDAGSDVGAAWLRLWTPPEVGYGFLDAATPELSMAVRPEARGRGIGSALARQLLARAGGQYTAVSLSVTAENPARRLYARLGFVEVQRAGQAITMRWQPDARHGDAASGPHVSTASSCRGDR